MLLSWLCHGKGQFAFVLCCLVLVVLVLCGLLLLVLLCAAWWHCTGSVSLPRLRPRAGAASGALLVCFVLWSCCAVLAACCCPWVLFWCCCAAPGLAVLFCIGFVSVVLFFLVWCFVFLSCAVLWCPRPRMLCAVSCPFALRRVPAWPVVPPACRCPPPPPPLEVPCVVRCRVSCRVVSWSVVWPVVRFAWCLWRACAGLGFLRRAVGRGVALGCGLLFLLCSAVVCYCVLCCFRLHCLLPLCGAPGYCCLYGALPWCVWLIGVAVLRCVLVSAVLQSQS